MQDAMSATTRRALVGLDILVNNAGVNTLCAIA